MIEVDVRDGVNINGFIVVSNAEVTRVTDTHGDTFELGADVAGLHATLRSNGVPNDAIRVLRELGV